ncbi:uncharacterized protein [Triticum aestivum]|uniref:uncharacterized protein isoform X2 n=1 Tax=Triticum aestivum TaxID=4565 RepID=UPI001D00D348|nr:uncharacterized protein LOC123188720 isoform X2 [Triticum aestivum]
MSVSASWVPMPLLRVGRPVAVGKGPLFSSMLAFSSSHASHSVHARFAHCCALYSSPRFIPFERPVLRLCHPFLHGCCWLSLLGFHVGSFVGAWVVPSLLSSYQWTQKRYVPYFLRPKNIPSMTRLKNSRMRDEVASMEVTHSQFSSYAAWYKQYENSRHGSEVYWFWFTQNSSRLRVDFVGASSW